jgi:hypothetical protein
LVDLQRDYETGTRNPISDTTFRLTGQPPRTFRRFLSDDPGAFA